MQGRITAGAEGGPGEQTGLRGDLTEHGGDEG